MPDNIMKDVAGQPVQVPGNQEPPIVKDPEGTPVVPAGTEKPMEQAPKDTLPRPATQPDVPAQQIPPVEGGTEPPEAVPQVVTEKTITFDDLAAKKGFRSPDDLATAYANLESQNKRVEVTLADAIKARQETDPQPNASESIENDDLDDDKDALKIVDSRIDRKVKSVEDTMDYKFHLIQNPNDQQYAAEAIKVVRENPGIKWSTAFEAARSRSAGTQMQQAREEGKNEAYQAIEVKQDAQIVPGGQQRTDTTPIPVKEFIGGIKSGKIPLPEARKVINELSKVNQ